MDEPSPKPAYRNILPGDSLPRFKQLCQGIQFAPDAMAGRYLVFCFYGADDALGRAAIAAVRRGRERFDDARAAIFFVGTDAADQASGRYPDAMPGLRFMWDLDGSVGERLGSVPCRSDGPQRPVALRRRFWLRRRPLAPRAPGSSPSPADGSDMRTTLFDASRRPAPSRRASPASRCRRRCWCCPTSSTSDLCRHLVGLYDAARRRRVGRDAEQRRRVRPRLQEPQGRTCWRSSR